MVKVSVVTVCYNSVGTIENTIKNVLCQDYVNIEYIIVDNLSTDGTRDIIAKYKAKIAKIISEPDNGIYDAMNKGIKLSTGDIVTTLNSDDIYADRTIVSQMVNFIGSSNLDAAYGDLVYVTQKNTERVVRLWRAGKYKKGAFRYGWVLPHPTFFCRKDIFERFGYFNSTLQIAADFELTLRFVEKYKIKVDYLPKVIVKMRTGGKANTLNGIIRGNIEIIRALRINGFHLSPLFFIFKPIEKISQLSVRHNDIE